MDMALGQLISAEEYLHTSFEHDAEYVDGKVVHRAMPNQSHSDVLAFLIAVFYAMREDLGIRPWPDQRIRTQADPRHYRVPDICVTYGRPLEQVYTTPPFLCIEILSPDDSAVELRAKIDEYLTFGVEYVWVIDPVGKTGEIYTRDSIKAVRDGRFVAGALQVDLTQMKP
jgi:Uma2 family endonuclease